MSSNYYEFREAKVNIAHALMARGWNVQGYHADESDSMTDYYSPAYWNGIATKNGYIFVVDCSHAVTEEKPIYKYDYEGNFSNYDNIQKIQKLEALTVARGATEAEETAAKERIKALKEKAEEENKKACKIVGYETKHQANPPHAKWHIEKDGIIIAKGKGIAKYSGLPYGYEFESNTTGWSRKDKITDEQKSIVDTFRKFIFKIDSLAGAMLGEGEAVQYENVVVTEYKKVLKPVQTSDGSVKEGQLFILKTSFNYGRIKDYVYRIHRTEYNGRESFHAYRLNGKLDKECTGHANTANYWSISSNFMKWIEQGHISWCELEEVKTPYEVTKCVKKVIKSASKAQDTTPAKTDKLHYTVTEDTDTRDNSKIFLVKIIEKLDTETYKKVAEMMKQAGGYYSKFKHAFLFRSCPKIEGLTLAKEIQEEALKEADEQPKAEPENITQPAEDTQPEAVKIRVAYSTINEGTAKRAKEMNSFSDYIPGSATNEYKSEVDEVAKIAQRKAEKYPEEIESIQNLLDRYSRKLAEWYNRYYNIECQCPSILITGAGNFPVNKKNKQNQARESHHAAYSKIEYIVDKIKSIGTGPIKRNDENAIEKLQNKLDKLKQSQELMKAVNAYYRKHKTLDGCIDITEELKNSLEKSMQNSWRTEPKPFESYSLQNNNANIKSTQKRLEALQKAKAQPTESKTEEYNCSVCEVVENTDIMRIQLIFEGKPNEETRNILKSNGFKWSPKAEAWQRQLTNNGKYATKLVIKKLEEMGQKQTA